SEPRYQRWFSLSPVQPISDRLGAVQHFGVPSRHYRSTWLLGQYPVPAGGWSLRRRKRSWETSRDRNINRHRLGHLLRLCYRLLESISFGDSSTIVLQLLSSCWNLYFLEIVQWSKIAEVYGIPERVWQHRSLTCVLDLSSSVSSGRLARNIHCVRDLDSSRCIPNVDPPTR